MSPPSQHLLDRSAPVADRCGQRFYQLIIVMKVDCGEKEKSNMESVGFDCFDLLQACYMES